MSLRIPIRIIVDMGARLFPLRSGRVGEAIITITDTTVPFAMAGIRDVRGGIDE
jgi:hypothetical protein